MASTQILVLGAGELGTAILTHLSHLAPPQTNISVLLRESTLSSPSPSKTSLLTHLKALDISFIAGDIATQSHQELTSLFKPYDLIISCLGFASGPGSQVKITKAVLEAGVKRFVPWQFGVDYEVVGRGSVQPVWDEQMDIRELLRGQDGYGGKRTEWVIVSTGMFMSFLFEGFFGVVDEVGKGGEGDSGIVVRALGDWENRVTVTTADDIGRLTAMIVYAEPRIKNQVVYTAGETVSYKKVADVVEKVTGRKVKREVWSVDKLKEDLRNDPEDNVKRYRVVFAEGKGVSWDMDRTFNVQRGIEVVGLESFAREKFA